MKNILILSLLIFLLVMGCKSSIHSVVDEKLPWIDFEWVTHNVQDKTYEKASINIPVNIGDIKDSFTMQFDLGANLTMLYGQTFNPYFKAYSDLNQKIDTINGYPYLTATELILNESHRIDNFSFFYESNFGEILNDGEVGNDRIKHIGTIGADLLKEKILIIDYPAKRIAILDSIPTAFQKTDENLAITLDRWGRVHLPIQINGEEKKVLFDTGSSMFPLMTTTSNWKIYTDTLKQDSILTSTWGEVYYTYAANANKVRLGSTDLDDSRVFDGQHLSAFIEQENIWGIMGNAHFYDDIIVIDFKNLKFGWIKNSSKQGAKRQ